MVGGSGGLFVSSGLIVDGVIMAKLLLMISAICRAISSDWDEDTVLSVSDMVYLGGFLQILAIGVKRG